MNRLVLRRLRTAAAIASALTFTAPAVADAYLDALKAEAAKGSGGASSPQVADGRPSPRTDDQVQMERWLQQEFVGTYVFYQKLSDRRKQIVHQFYRDGAPIEELRTKINELTKQ